MAEGRRNTRGEGRRRPGGTAVPASDTPGPSRSESPPDAPPALTDAEVVQLRIRVIALENLVIALLTSAPDAASDRARRLARYIVPRPGFTPHRATIHAANQMTHLVERARRLLARTNDGDDAFDI